MQDISFKFVLIPMRHIIPYIYRKLKLGWHTYAVLITLLLLGGTVFNSSADTWYTKSANHLNIHYPEKEKALAAVLMDMGTEHLIHLEEKLDYRQGGTIELVLANQNATSSAERFSHLLVPKSGKISVRHNRIFIDPNQPLPKIREELTYRFSNALVTELLLGESVQEQYKYAVLLELPDWFFQGVIEYASVEWDTRDENRLRDVFEFNKTSNFQSLSSKYPNIIGKSFWHFVEKQYGPGYARKLLYLVRLSRDTEGSIQYLFQTRWRHLLKQWEKYYLVIFTQNMRLGLPRHLLPIPLQAGEQITQFEPMDSNCIALVIQGTNCSKLAVFNQLTDEFDVVKSQFKKPSWILCNGAKKGEVLVYNNEQGLWLSLRKGSLEKLDTPKVPGLCECFRFGSSQAAVSWDNARGKILVLDTAKKWNLWYSSPEFMDGVYPVVSNRAVVRKHLNYPANTFRFESIDLVSGRTDTLQVGNSAVAVQPISDNQFYVLSFHRGIVNQYWFSEKRDTLLPLTDYRRNIEKVKVKHNRLYEVLVVNSQTGLYVSEVDLDDPVLVETVKHVRTAFQMTNPKEKDNRSPDSTVLAPDTVDYYLLSEFPDSIDFSQVLTDSIFELNKRKARVEERIYSEGGYRQDFLVFQVNNDLLFNRAQNPFLPIDIANRNRLGLSIGVAISNMTQTIQANSYFRTYGSGLGSDLFVEMEFQQKIDQPITLSYYRQFRNASTAESVVNHYTQEGRIGTYFSLPIANLKTQILYRIDQKVPLAKNEQSLKDPIRNQQLLGPVWNMSHTLPLRWRSTKHDLRYHMSGQHLMDLSNQDWLHDLEATLELTTKIHPFIHWTQKGKMGWSLGKKKSVFILGGMDNSIGGTIVNLPILDEKMAFYKPMNGVRGFDKNRRSGHQFWLVNSNLDIQLIPLLYHYPIRSAVLHHMVLTGFFDVASAWYGAGPYDPVNPLQTDFISRGPMTIEVRSLKNPIIYGYGFGLKTEVWGIQLGLYRAFGRETENRSYRRTHFVLGWPL